MIYDNVYNMYKKKKIINHAPTYIITSNHIK